MDQLTVVVYVRLQLQSTKHELRGMTQTCTARSDEWPQRSSRIHTWSKFMNFQAKFCLYKQPGRRNNNANRQFAIFLRAWWSTSHFLRNSLFSAKIPRTTQLTFVYLWQLTLSPKALCYALHCPLYSPWTLNNFIYVAAELYIWLDEVHL